MTKYAPETPTLPELQAQYPLSDEAEIEIPLGRERISEILNGEYAGLLANIGPCALTDDHLTIDSEGQQLAALTRDHQGLYATHRLPPWKPRTNPNDWHGLETTNPAGAYRTLVSQAHKGVSLELGLPYHAERYGALSVMGWIGGRNAANEEHMQQVALHDTALPLAVKNGLDGQVEPMIDKIHSLQELRGPDAAPVVLLYRGGENARTPDAWEDQYRQALELTDGQMIVDVAHGSEMAHNPAGIFEKSVGGQVRALGHVVTLAKQGLTPAGVMMEASSAESPTDPHMPFDIALRGMMRLYELRMGVRAGAATL